MYPPANYSGMAKTSCTATACIGTPKSTPANKNIFTLIRSSAAVGPPFTAVRGYRTLFLLVNAALLQSPTALSAMPNKQQVPFTVSVAPALGTDFGYQLMVFTLQFLLTRHARCI